MGRNHRTTGSNRLTLPVEWGFSIYGQFVGQAFSPVTAVLPSPSVTAKVPKPPLGSPRISAPGADRYRAPLSPTFRENQQFTDGVSEKPSICSSLFYGAT